MIIKKKVKKIKGNSPTLRLGRCCFESPQPAIFCPGGGRPE